MASLVRQQLGCRQPPSRHFGHADQYGGQIFVAGDGGVAGRHHVGEQILGAGQGHKRAGHDPLPIGEAGIAAGARLGAQDGRQGAEDARPVVAREGKGAAQRIDPSPYPLEPDS